MVNSKLVEVGDDNYELSLKLPVVLSQFPDWPTILNQADGFSQMENETYFRVMTIFHDVTQATKKYSPAETRQWDVDLAVRVREECSASRYRRCVVVGVLLLLLLKK